MNIEECIELINNQKFKEAILPLSNLIESSDGIQAYYWRSVAYLKMSQLDEALNDLNKAIESYDEYANAYTQRGVVYFHLGELELALKDMDKAVDLEKDNPYRYSSRAYIKGQMKDTESAIEDYKIAIKLDPEDAVAHNNLGLLEEQLGYASKSKKRFEEADRLSVNDQGELIQRDNTKVASLIEEKVGEINKEIKQNQSSKSSNKGFLYLLKNTFTTKDGFKEYWKFVKGIFSSESSARDSDGV